MSIKNAKPRGIPRVYAKEDTHVKHFFLMAGNGFCFVSVRKGSSNEEGSLERGKLRNKLFNFIKSRPTKESLEQKGIIKGNL